MTDFDQNKSLQINQILHVVKIASLFFSAIALFQYYTNGDYTDLFSLYDVTVLVTSLVLVLATYGLWYILQLKVKNKQLFATWVEPSIFLSISFLCLLFTGAAQSDYKFLFIFVIISSSIECSMKASLVITGVSSALIIGIDLIPFNRITESRHFESDMVLICAFFLISWTIGFYVSMERQHIANLKDLANIDGLTGLYNHRYFYDSLEVKTKQCDEKGQTLALLFIDIDYFKYYNDLNGHQKGDEVLRSISRELKKICRKDDVVSRYGGEEFAIILPDTPEEKAYEIAEKLRLIVQEQYFSGQEYLPNKNLTISVGLSVYPTRAKSATELVKNADEALYRAKFLRKNRVETYYSILDDLQEEINEDDREIIASIKTLIAVINARDKYTFKHVERVVSYCLLMASRLHLDDQTKKIFIYAAYMHDIGKINISQEILIKSTPLTQEEWEILKEHPKNGVEIIKNVSVLKDVVPVILQHHERYDGTGYPNHLKGRQINYLARILTVADSFDAMTSSRPYQKKKTFPEAFEELMRCRGTQFDPDIVLDFIRIIRENFSNPEF